MACPRCETPLLALPQGPGSLFDCAQCGGQFVENALLRDLVEQQRVVRPVAGFPPTSQVPSTETVRYLACPACAKLMHRKNFGRRSGVIVDVCPHHGIWFDAGELPRILSFVSSGGLERAAALHREEERMASLRGGSSGPSSAALSSGVPSHRFDAELLSDLAEVGRDFLGYLRTLIR
ncbi:MAG: zf-TFIIB domain-containing protein [Polyangiaceae bacterium]|nr:zf-TFIIB domain-containing protein [Polyangiaceae bacterium]